MDPLFSFNPEYAPIAATQGSNKIPAKKVSVKGRDAFYNSDKYNEVTKDEFSSDKRLPISYSYNTESKISRVVKDILSIVIFPVGIYRALHVLAAKIAILPASTPKFLHHSQESIKNLRSEVSVDGEWKYKRLTIEVNGYKIDAAIMGKTSTLGNGRWVLSSGGSGELYENKLSEQHHFKHILSSTESNGIVFNYPGVGASSGMPSRKAMKLAYQAVLRFLEDEHKGIGAKQIIGYGHSIGAAVQAEAIDRHNFKDDIEYVFVKSRTFSNLSKVASTLTIKPLGFLVKILGWNMNTLKSSEKLTRPEIILQTVALDRIGAADDGMVAADASLTNALLDSVQETNAKKIFIGIEEKHNIPLKESTIDKLAEQIKKLLR